MKTIFAGADGLTLYIIAGDAQHAADILNIEREGINDGVNVYRYSESDMIECDTYSLAAGYFPFEISTVAKAFAAGNLFTTRDF